MQVICINEGYMIHKETKEYVKLMEVYTVKNKESGYSNIAQRFVDAYEFEELKGLFECDMFVLIDNFDAMLLSCIKTKSFSKLKR